MSSWSVFNVFSPDFCDKFISKTLLHILHITIYIDLKAIKTTKTNDQIYPDKTQLFQYRYLDHRLLEYPFLVICSLPWYSHSLQENESATISFFCRVIFIPTNLMFSFRSIWNSKPERFYILIPTDLKIMGWLFLASSSLSVSFKSAGCKFSHFMHMQLHLNMHFCTVITTLSCKNASLHLI